MGHHMVHPFVYMSLFSCLSPPILTGARPAGFSESARSRPGHGEAGRDGADHRRAAPAVGDGRHADDLAERPRLHQPGHTVVEFAASSSRTNRTTRPTPKLSRRQAQRFQAGKVTRKATRRRRRAPPPPPATTGGGGGGRARPPPMGAGGDRLAVAVACCCWVWRLAAAGGQVVCVCSILGDPLSWRTHCDALGFERVSSV